MGNVWSRSLAWARRFGQLIRFYQAALINTVFGFGLYALLIRAGLNLYLAQIVAQIAGVAFNYLTYSRHVFHDQRGDKRMFVAAYLVNYLVNLALLALFHRGGMSSYAAGLAATIVASLINFFVLKRVVFTRAAA